MQDEGQPTAVRSVPHNAQRITSLPPHRPACPTLAAAPLSTPKARTTGSGMRSEGPPILKFWMERCVCAPHSLHVSMQTRRTSVQAGRRLGCHADPPFDPLLLLPVTVGCSAAWAGRRAGGRAVVNVAAELTCPAEAALDTGFGTA